MALTKIPAHLSSTPSISDSGTSTAITIDSSGHVTLAGNLVVSGSTTTADNLVSADKNITLNYHASNDTSSAANGAGITIQDAVNSSTDATILWNATDDRFDTSHPLMVNSPTDHSTVAILHAGGGTPNRGLKISTFSATNSNAGVELDAQHSTGAFKFSTGGTERARIDSSGQLGINDTNPDRKVSIIGDSTSEGQYPLSLDATNTDYTLEFRRNGQSEWWIKQAGSSFNIHENGVGDHFRILAGGNIGLGTTSPSSFNSRGRNLVVNSDGDTGITISANTSSSSTLLFADAYAGTGGTSAYRGSIEYDHATDHMAISTAATERMRIDADGNVGIGVTPSGWAGGTLGLQIKNSGLYGYAQSGINELGHTTNIYYDGGWKTISNDVGSLFYHSGENGFIFGTTPAATAGTGVSFNESMRITAGGNVGIGETSPANLLHVKASDTGIAPHASAQIALEREGTNYLQFLTAETGTSGVLFGDGSDVDVSGVVYDHNVAKMYIRAETSDVITIDGTNRKVGIRETTPLGFLHIKEEDSGQSSVNGNFDQLVIENSAHSGISILSGTGNDGAIYFGDSGANNRGQFKYRHASDSFGFITADGAGYALILESDDTAIFGGDVGIGETSPDSKLHVVGRLHHKRSTGTTHTGASSTSRPISDVSIIGSKLRWSLEVYFANGASGYGIRVYVDQTSLWLAGEVCIGSTYSNASATGLNRYSFSHNYNGSNNYGNVLTQTESYGQVASHFTFQSHGWDSTEGAHYFEFRHNNSYGNHMYLQFEGLGSSPAHANMATWYYKHITF